MSEQSNHKEHLLKVYQDLVRIVRQSVDHNIDVGSINHAVESVMGVFEQDLYNDLILYCYASSTDNYIYAHIANNVVLSVGFATSLGLSKEDIRDIGLCAFGHDFGMVEYLELIQKPTELTPQENLNIQNHPLKSAEIFKPYFSPRVIDGILDVHECVNGQGYPKAKVASEISFLAKIVTICDIFEALTHPRTFRAEFSPYASMKMIIKKKDKIFEKNVVKKFLEFLSIYPVGSLIRVNTGETGIVVASNPQFPTRSQVRVLLNEKKEVKPSDKVINLMMDHMLYISGCLDPKEEKEIIEALKPRGEIHI